VSDGVRRVPGEGPRAQADTARRWQRLEEYLDSLDNDRLEEYLNNNELEEYPDVEEGQV
jgi:hypothetical protein